ncbi:MAG: hypothetical protein QM661_09585 [Solimonas sp.]
MTEVASMTRQHISERSRIDGLTYRKFLDLSGSDRRDVLASFRRDAQEAIDKSDAHGRRIGRDMMKRIEAWEASIA